MEVIKLALIHQFAVIPNDSNLSIISSDMDFVDVSDILVQYFGDSLKWVYTAWNGKNRKSGISYYGFSIIEGDEIEKLKNIVKAWKELFFLSPEELNLTGNFLPDEGRYEKISMVKKEILKELDGCIDICQKAINENAKVLHNGI